MGYIASNGKDLKENSYKVLSQYLPGRTEENYEKSHFGLSASEPETNSEPTE
jgi:hypothetical protein